MVMLNDRGLGKTDQAQDYRKVPVPTFNGTEHANSGEGVAFPQVGGLHHRYERMAA